MSVVPPAENGTMIVMALAGKAWACAVSGVRASRLRADAAARVRVRRVDKKVRDMMCLQ